MSITTGFNAPLSDAVVIDQNFDTVVTGVNTENVVSTYILVDQPFTDLVYENQFGNPQYLQSVPAGLIPISATKILTSATVRGTPRSTLPLASIATTSWMASYKY